MALLLQFAVAVCRDTHFYWFPPQTNIFTERMNQDHSLCLPAIPGQQVSRSGRAPEGVGLFLSISASVPLSLHLLDARPCYCTHKVLKVLYFNLCLPTCQLQQDLCHKRHLCAAMCWTGHTVLCPEAAVVFSLQVQLWESSARDRARDSVPEGKEVAPECQQGHL